MELVRQELGVPGLPGKVWDLGWPGVGAVKQGSGGVSRVSALGMQITGRFILTLPIRSHA